jgi:hypothetical protein
MSEAAAIRIILSIGPAVGAVGRSAIVGLLIWVSAYLAQDWGREFENGRIGDLEMEITRS